MLLSTKQCTQSRQEAFGGDEILLLLTPRDSSIGVRPWFAPES